MSAKPGTHSHSLAVILIIVLLACLCPWQQSRASAVEAPAAPSPGLDTEWIRHARIAGATFLENMSEITIEGIMDSLAAEGVTVVEADSFLACYLTDAQYNSHMDLVRKVAASAHRKGLRVVWCSPALASVTPGGRLRDRGTMALDHADWLQQSFDRRRVLDLKNEEEREKAWRSAFNDETLNYFYGAGAAGESSPDETAILCPNSPYREYYFERIKKLAATGVDGIWFDGAIFNTTAARWPCADRHCQSRFSQDTGLGFPGRAFFSEPSFRAWIAWRHRNLADFLGEAAREAREKNPELRCIVSVPGCDHLAVTQTGLDGLFLGKGLDTVWIVDAISDTTGMRDAETADWLSLMVTFKYCGSAAATEGKWAFSYGSEESDGQLVLAALLAGQLNPYETRIPSKATSVGRSYRTRMFSWVRDNEKSLFDTQSAAPAAILYSPETRDFVDGTRSGGFYLTPTPPTPAVKWWISSRDMVLGESFYLSEYKGWGIFFIVNHIPFDIISLTAATAESLARYRAVVLPNTVCLSDSSSAELHQYVKNGGNLIVTGGDAARCDEKGTTRAEPCWKKYTGPDFRQFTETREGQGSFFIEPALAGRAMLPGGSMKESPRILSYLENKGVKPLIEGKAPIYVQCYEGRGELVLHAVNYGWTGNKPLAVKSEKAKIAIPLGEGKKAASITASAPGEEEQTVPFSMEGNRAVFTIEVPINRLIRVRLE
ncbi:MAG: beta-galactosidase trimerization domain-containing protein [Candidatus Eremiobacteraeota bacterium]|nr:beta-galactosidase trimerization domain-containing protein [Candidatus Eremiobacteraeota bacterium]